MELSRIAFPITVLPEDDQTDFAQEERLNLPCWTMIWAICVVVDESKCLDIPIREFSIILEHLPFLPSISRYCVSCLSCAPWLSGNDIHDFCCRHLRCWWSLFCKYCIRSRIVFCNITAEHNSTFVFLVFCLQFSIFRWHMSINDAKCTVLPSFLVSAITSFLFLTFVSCHSSIFSSLFSLFIHCCFCIWYFHCLRHTNKFAHKIVVTQWNHSFSSNMIFMTSVKSSFQSDSHKFVSFNSTSVFCLVFSNCATGFLVLATLTSEFPTFYEHFSFFAWIPHHQVQWSKYHVISWHYPALASR